MLIIQTSQYKCTLPSRMNICVGTNDPMGKLFAPASWDFVMLYKSGKMTKETYEKKYLTLLEHRKKQWPEHFKKLLKKNEITFVCFCAPGAFCHRVLAARWFEEAFSGKCMYGGEV